MAAKKVYPPRGSNFYDPNLHKLRPVVALDIDGTLGSWHDHFLVFAGHYLDRSFSYYTGEVSMAEHMRVSKTTYRKVKLAFRQGGLKRFMPVLPGASDLTRALRKGGAEVWICTTRPYLRLDNIDPDTRHWLRRNGIQYDGVIFGERKYQDLAKCVDRRRIVTALEDLPEQYNQAWLVTQTYPLLMDAPHNWHFKAKVRVQNCSGALFTIKAMITDWEEDNGR